MKYKTIEGEDGSVVGVAVNEKGLPVMVGDDGAEVAIDAIHLYSKIPSLQEEAKNHRLKAKEFQDELDSFKEKYSGIEDPSKALEALTKMQDIEGQKLIDSKDAEALRLQLQDAHDKELSGIKKTYDEKITELSGIINSQQADIFDSLVLQNFNNSQWFAGENPKTHLVPEIAKDHFGKHFKVEKNSAGKTVVIGYHLGGESDGQKIFSIERPGEIAGFDEAMSMIIDKHPQRDNILRASFGGGAGGADNTPSANKLEKLKKDYAAALASKNTALANRLIRQINSEESKNK